MISWWWIIPAFIFGGIAGVFTMGLVVAGTRSEDYV